MHTGSIRRIAVPLAIVAVFAMALQPATAAKRKPRTFKKTLTATYELPGERVSSRRVIRDDDTCAAGECRGPMADGRADVGGVAFDPMVESGKSTYSTVTIKLWDDIDWHGQVSVRACDSIFTTICSDSTVSQYACLKRGEPMTLRNVPRTKYVVVLVYAAWSCTQYVNDVPSGQGAGTSGRVQAKFVWRA